jgi:hypothetical protein
MTGQGTLGKIAGRLKAAFSRQGQSEYRQPQAAPVDPAVQIRKLRQTRTRMTAAKPLEIQGQQP